MLVVRLAVATTTIHNAADTWRWLSACDDDVPILIAGDVKTPELTIPGNARYFSYEAQHDLGYKCSNLIGPNSIERRNIVVLEALRDKADAIVLHDTDNIPLTGFYFDEFISAFHSDGMNSKLQVTGRDGWFDPGSLLQPPVRHRGFPHQIASAYDIAPPSGLKVGLAAGIVLGDPDIGAVERIAKQPTVHGFSELLRQGIVVDNNTWTITNSQNTAVLRQFAPCMLTCPQFGRYADIFSSLICQRVMREHGYAVHLGLSPVWQQRNKHDLVKDLQDEMFGMAHVVEFAEVLNNAGLGNGNIVSQVDDIYDTLAAWRFCPEGVPELAEAWLADCEGVL